MFEGVIDGFLGPPCGSPSSLTDLPLAVRDVGDDGLYFRFFVSRTGRSHMFPDIASFRPPAVPPTALVRGPLSFPKILLDSPTCCSEEFTELVANLHIARPSRNRICILPSPPPVRSGRVIPSTAHPPLRGYDDFSFASRERQFTKFVPVLGLHLCQMLSCLLGGTTVPDPED